MCRRGFVPENWCPGFHPDQLAVPPLPLLLLPLRTGHQTCELGSRRECAAVRWHGTALAVRGRGRPCYRCLFEDVPLIDAPNCAEAGVVGPMVGIVAAAQADLALSLLAGDDVAGELFTFDGRTLDARRRRIRPRSTCALCGDAARIHDIQANRYVEGVCPA